MNNGKKKNTEQSFFFDASDKEKLAKSNFKVSNDPELAKAVWQVVMQEESRSFDLEEQKESIPKPSRNGWVREIPDDIARTMWAICRLSKIKPISEPPCE